MEAHTWVKAGTHAEVHDKLEPMEVPTEQTPFQPETSFRHTSVGQRATFLPQLPCAVSTTAQKPEDEWAVADVKELSKLVSRLKTS